MIVASPPLATEVEQLQARLAVQRARAAALLAPHPAQRTLQRPVQLGSAIVLRSGPHRLEAILLLKGQSRCWVSLPANTRVERECVVEDLFSPAPVCLIVGTHFSFADRLLIELRLPPGSAAVRFPL